MKWKALLILIAIVALSVGAVFVLLYGFGRDDQAVKAALLPSDEEAKQYVLDNKLLSEIREQQKIRVGGPTFKMVTGFDAQGQEKIVWLTLEKKQIKSYGSAFTKDGVTKDLILAKAKEKNVQPENIKEMYIAPYDYVSDKIVWFILEKGERGHMLWYDFKTGDPVWEAYQEPTSWSLKNHEP
ncbi:hypothetical protein [Paenibacillus sp. MBLB4367]|uniref:hypothetical protein n=1 Tax=Paenibacillus sp. MBLB4367 TaxID=3384767 RepID=UPI0039080CC5